MNLLFDNIIYSKEKQGGISNYWYELTSRFLGDNYSTRFIENIHDFKNLCRNKIIIPTDQLLTSTIKSQLLARLSSVKVNTGDYYLYHSSFYRPLKTTDSYCEVTTLHDFTHNYYFPFHKRILHNHFKYSAIKRSKGIICVSENTYRDMQKFCAPGKEKKTTVIYNGVSDEYYPIAGSEQAEHYLKQNGIEKDKFVLYVGGRAFYKNFDFAVEAVSELPGNIKLVTVGSKFTDSEIKKIQKLGAGKVINLSNISNLQLNLLYNNALCLLYPSNYEGFGIPVVEAMKAGCPVIAVNSSSIPEISGDAVLLMEKAEIGCFKKNIFLLGQRKEELIDSGFKQSARFSWEKCYKETSQFYKEVYDES
ncbi:MAG: glycosyltransferase family 1 protein [Lacibacter sp.]